MDSYGMAENGLSWLWRASWQASVLALLVLMVQGLLRSRLSPGWRFALWWLVLARLILPVAPSSAWSVYNLAPGARLAEDPTESAAFVDPPRTIPTAVSRSAGLRPLSTGHLPAAAPSWPTGVGSFGGPAKPVLTRLAHPPSLREWLFPVVGWMWVAGALFCAGRLILGSILLTRVLRGRTVVADEGILGTLEDCRRTMGVARALEVLATSAVDSPALFGWWRCRLLVPTRMVGTFSLDEWRHVFLHEMAHIRRHDVPVNGLMVALQSLHWFNPLVWFACHRMRADRELACDAAALSHAPENEAKAYGRTIIKLLDGLGRTTGMPALVGILEDKNQIQQRIRMIAGFKKSQRWPVLAGLVLAALSLLTLTDAQIKPSPEPSRAVTPSSPGAPPSAASAVRPAVEGHDTRVRTNATFLLSNEATGSRERASTRSPDTAKTNRADSLRIESEEIELSPGQAVFRGGVKATQFAGGIAKGVVSCGRLTLKLSTNGNGIEQLLAENEVRYEVDPAGSTHRPFRKLTSGRLEGEVDQGTFARWVAYQNVQMEGRAGIASGEQLVCQLTEDSMTISGGRLETPQGVLSGTITWQQKQGTLSASPPWKLTKRPDADQPDGGTERDRNAPAVDENQNTSGPAGVGYELWNEDAQAAEADRLRQRLEDKLDRIVFDQYPTRPTEAGRPLGAFLEDLEVQCHAVDPTSADIRFLIKPVFERAANPEPGALDRIDPATGLKPGMDLRTHVTVRISPPLRRTRLRDVLDTMVRVAQVPHQLPIPALKYTLDKHSIVVSSAFADPQAGTLLNKTFKVDPIPFIGTLQKILAARPETKSATGKVDEAFAGESFEDRSGWVLPFVNRDTERQRSEPPTMDLSLSHGIGGGGGGGGSRAVTPHLSPDGNAHRPGSGAPVFQQCHGH